MISNRKISISFLTLLDQVTMNPSKLSKLIETNSNSFEGLLKIESIIGIKMATSKKPSKLRPLDQSLQPETPKHMTNQPTKQNLKIRMFFSYGHLIKHLA